MLWKTDVTLVMLTLNLSFPLISERYYCFAKEGEVYLVYLAYVSSSTLDLRGTNSSFSVDWFNPEQGGSLLKGKVRNVKGGALVDFGVPPKGKNTDWLILIRKR